MAKVDPSLFLDSSIISLDHNICGEEFFNITLAKLVEILPRPVTTYAERRRLLNDIRNLGTPTIVTDTHRSTVPANVRKDRSSCSLTYDNLLIRYLSTRTSATLIITAPSCLIIRPSTTTTTTVEARVSHRLVLQLQHILPAILRLPH